MNREELVWALIFSVPVGLGVSLAVLKASGGRLSLLVVGPGLLTMIVLFLLVVGGVHEPEDALE